MDDFYRTRNEHSEWTDKDNTMDPNCTSPSEVWPSLEIQRHFDNNAVLIYSLFLLLRDAPPTPAPTGAGDN